MKKLVLTLLVYSITFANAQNRQIDSLQNILKEAKPDTNRVNALVQLSKEYFGLFSYDLCTLYANKAKELSQKINYKKGEITALTIVGAAHFNKTEYRFAQNCYDSALKLCPELGMDVQRYKLYFNIANVYYVLGHYREALDKYQPCLAYYKKTKDLSGLANCYNNIGNVYSSYENKNESALENYTEALKIYGQLGDKNKLATSYINIGAVYLNTSDFDKAYDNFNQSMNLYRENGDVAGIAGVYSNFGALFLKQDKYEDALLNYKEAEKYYTELNNTYDVARAQSGICQSLFGLEKYSQALEYGEKSVKNALETGNSECLQVVYNSLSKTEEKLNHHKKALSYYKNHIAMRDSLFGEETTRRIEQIEMQAKFDKQEALTKLQQQEKEALLINQNKVKDLEIEQTKLITLFVGIGLLFLLLLTYLFFRQRRLKAERKNAVLEQKNLRLQMNPHFLFNSLNSIQRMFIEGKTEAASDVVGDFSNLLRRILNNSGMSVISLREEIETLKLYMDIEKIRCDNGFDYLINIGKHIDLNNTKVPPLIIQPFVENAIWHGILPSKKQGTITIEINQSSNGQQLVCSISDTGVGIDLEKLNKPEARGIKITEQRLSKKIVFEKLKQGGTIVKITIPVKK
ncbi:MAG: tetratricopeptide repeat protein [Bacteroidia bacterium]|nr:tetratricopeptide repeat protein [Bacteroidia bacterium]